MPSPARKSATPRPKPRQLQIEVDRIKQEAREATVAAVQHLDLADTVEPDEVDQLGEPFGAWLIAQAPLKREGLIGDLAKAAKADPRFPKRGDPETVRNHVGLLGADGDVFAAIEDAETEWLRG